MSGPSTPDSLSLFPLHARELLERPSDVIFRGLSTRSYSEFEIRSPPSSLSSCSFGSSSQGSSAICCSADPSRSDREPFFLSFQHPAKGLRALVQVLSWTPVRALTFSAALTAPATGATDTYASALGALHALEELTLVPPDELTGRTDVFAALQPDPTYCAGGRGTEMGGVRCPRLRVLRVHGACTGVEDARDILSALEACARARKSAGAGIEAVDVHLWDVRSGGCDTLGEEAWTREALKRMEAYVGKVSCQFGYLRTCATCAER